MIRTSLVPVVNQDMLRKCVVFYAAIGSGSTPLGFSVDEIANTSPMQIRTDLVPVLRRGERFDIAATEATVKDYLRQLLNLTDGERQFLHFFAQKQYKPELLFDDSETLARIANHPMAIWKCEAKDAQ